MKGSTAGLQMPAGTTPGAADPEVSECDDADLGVSIERSLFPAEAGEETAVLRSTP